MLANEIRKFIRRLRSNGGSPAPADISELERQASLAFDGCFVTTTAPFAPVTWQADATLAPSDTSTGRIDLKFSRPVEIVGCHVSILSTGAGTRDATLEDILCQIDIDRESYKTTAINQDRTQSNFVTLSALDDRQRMLGLRVESAQPSVGLTLKWRNPSDAAANLKTAHIGAAFFCRWLDQP